jgi:hypothetical protein
VGLADPVSVQTVARLATSESAWLLGDLSNLQLRGDGLRLAGDRSYRQAGRGFGVFVSRVQPVETTFDLVQAQARFEGEAANLLVEARSSVDLERWSSWSPVALDGSPAALPPGRFFQYRLELSEGAADAPLVQALQFELASSGLSINAARSENPTVRVLGSREGLVGHRTANGHIIEERDEFAALPSRRALNPLGKQDYRVKISYKGRSASVPVWDVGPWNTRDNYWDAKRDLFGDLPRFQPQAYAAWAHDHNGGRDQYNRWVSFPASIDIADGTFIEDLKMTKSDWVDVTFLWVEAPSPPTSELPPFTRLKPEPNKSESPEAETSDALRKGTESHR